MQITYSSSADARAAAEKGQFAALISMGYERNEFGEVVGETEVWGVFKRRPLNNIDWADRMRNRINRSRDTESSGTYRGTYSDEVVGF